MKTYNPDRIIDLYFDTKLAYPDSILVLPMGDFHECFGSDAENIAKDLQITLTSRTKSDGSKVALAGFPTHSASRYINALKDKGHQVIVMCEVSV